MEAIRRWETVDLFSIPYRYTTFGMASLTYSLQFTANVLEKLFLRVTRSLGYERIPKNLNQNWYLHTMGNAIHTNMPKALW